MTAATLPTVSVVIPTHKRRDSLPPLLDALATEKAHEVLVVVNGGDDGSLALLERRAADDPRLEPVFVPEPSQVGALRAGVERAGGEVALMLDDDVIPEPGLVAGHAKHHAERQGTVVLGYMPVARSARRRPGQYPIDLYSRAYERVCDEYTEDPGSILRGLWAGNVSIGRADFLRVAQIRSEEMPAGYGYHEDRDFGLRCEAAGLAGVFDRGLRARHMLEKSPAAFLAAARSSGRTRAAVHAAHPEAIGELPEDFFEQGMPSPGRTLVRLARAPRMHRPVQALLGALTRIAGALRLWRLESHLGYVMGTVEQQRAARDAADAAPATERMPT
jgi:GT2 family glycosyltransferase